MATHAGQLLCACAHTERFPVSRGFLFCQERRLCFKRQLEGKTDFSILTNKYHMKEEKLCGPDPSRKSGIEL